MKKIYFLVLLCCTCMAASAQLIFQPYTTVTVTSGNTTYCKNATTGPIVATYNTCNSGTGGPAGASCSITWYYNLTNSTSIPSASVAAGPTPFTCVLTGSGTQSFTPTDTGVGTRYYFCVISWTGGTSGCAGGPVGSLVSNTQIIKVHAPLPELHPGSFGVDDTICLGSTLLLSDDTTGGTWTSGAAGTATVSSSGLVAGVAVGIAQISYSEYGCYTIRYVSVIDTPSAISPLGTVNVCIGGTTTLFDFTPGGTWLSSSSALATVGTSGIVTGVAAGNPVITYKFPSSGCYTTRTMTVLPNPVPIGGALAVCDSNTTSLSDASGPGLWSSSASGIASVGTSGIVTANAPGTATITFAFSTTGGCYTTSTVTVNLPPAVITGDSFHVCSSGGTITLVDAVAGGAWTSGIPAIGTVSPTSGVVTGIAAGVVNISYTTTGCPSKIHSVTVNALPAPIAGIMSGCDGLTTNLSDFTGGGSWLSSDTTIAKVGPLTGIVSGISLGAAVITYSLPTGCSVTTVFTVNPLAPVVGHDTICTGSGTLLTDIVGGGTWQSSNPAVATIGTTSGLVNGVVNGITFIVYTLPTACSTSFFLRVLPPIPTIAGMHKLCSGSSTTLSDVYTGGTWTSANSFVASVDSAGTMSGHYPDTVSITYSVYGCIARSVMTINPLPEPTITHDWTTSTVSTENFYNSYQWFDSSLVDTSGHVMPGATTASIFIPRADEYYRVEVTDTNGCTAMTDWYYRNYTSVNEVNEQSVHIYPNPASATVFVESPVRLKAVITNIEGQLMITQDNAKTINISRIPPGVYIMTLSDETGQVVATRKLVKE